MACDSTGKSSPTSFRRGTALLDFTTGVRQQARLDRIGDVTFLASFDPACPGGAQAEWTDSSDHWHLTVLSSFGPNDAFSGQWATLWLEANENDPPLYADGHPCVITITNISAAGLVGQAVCQHLRWLNDYEALSNPDEAKPIPNMPAFDVSISFEARP